MLYITQGPQETHTLHYIKKLALYYAGDTCSTKLTKHMLYITQEIHALHHTENTCTRLRRKHMHYITQETHALHYTGNTCSKLHRKYMLYIIQKMHALHFYRKHMLYSTQ